MSTPKNVDSVANANQGRFKPVRTPNGPTTTKGHQLGRKVNEADQRPEFHLETHRPGTAPASNSYTSNTDEGSQANNPDVLRSHGKEAVFTPASATLTGATSQDVHTGLGKPLQGQTSLEQRHDGEHGRKKDASGLENVGSHREDRTEERKFTAQRGLEKEEAITSGTRGDKAGRVAGDMRPEPAEVLAAEWKYQPTTKR